MTTWNAAVLVFYSATVEEYYTGELRLAIINGPNEVIEEKRSRG